MLEELYEKHDRRALEMKDVIATGKSIEENPSAKNTDLQAI